jgi:hypothetical protein
MTLKKMKRYVHNCISGTLLATGVYILSLSGIQAISHSKSPKIVDQSHLELKLTEEVENLAGKLDPNYLISAVLTTNQLPCYAKKVDENKYELVISKDWASESMLKHELYHIADGHCEGKRTLQNYLYTGSKYLFWHEPQATLYQITGLKP